MTKIFTKNNGANAPLPYLYLGGPMRMLDEPVEDKP